MITHADITDVPAGFVADPFMLNVNGTWHMFFEILSLLDHKGKIGWATSSDGLHWDYQRLVIDEPFHLSYPYVFEWQGEYYMVPESWEANGIRLYRADRFPDRWTFVGNLLEGFFLDVSLFRYQERWYFFAETNPEHCFDTLRLYCADELMGPWHEHPASPILQGDPQRARPAGRVRVEGDVSGSLSGKGRVIRFAQGCQPDYGINVRAFEVMELTPTRYREQEISQSPLFAPSGTGWNRNGMHHLDAHLLSNGAWLACVDGWSKV
ncbi:MAG: hypothetical protein HC771_19680 [Synechococcales cyanobacterium CRU_2_2]|nr:hypothetical protein [Synechococcales cyanobacterium CRU_2_2]